VKALEELKDPEPVRKAPEKQDSKRKESLPAEKETDGDDDIDDLERARRRAGLQHSKDMDGPDEEHMLAGGYLADEQSTGENIEPAGEADPMPGMYDLYSGPERRY